MTEDLICLRLATWSANHGPVRSLEQVNSGFVLDRENEENEGNGYAQEWSGTCDRGASTLSVPLAWKCTLVVVAKEMVGDGRIPCFFWQREEHPNATIASKWFQKCLQVPLRSRPWLGKGRKGETPGRKSPFNRGAFSLTIASNGNNLERNMCMHRSNKLKFPWKRTGKEGPGDGGNNNH